jgi:hypothetical protein
VLAALLAVLCVAQEGSVVVVTLDGVRWQDVFGGADDRLLDKKAGGVQNLVGLNERYGGETREERRRKLAPFLWDVVAKDGRIWGNASRENVVRVSNGLNFSYPGYAELLCGVVDPKIDSNDKKPNGNVTVLEWLSKRPGFQGRVAAFCSWDVFPSILNRETCGFPVWCGDPLPGRDDFNAALRDTPVPWKPGSYYDVLAFIPALEHLKAKRPRVLYLALGETDEWAHLGRYDLYLDALHRADGYLRKLWETAQSIPEMKGNTALLVTTDHGRGDGGESWKSHGKDVAGAGRIWIGLLGPGVPAGGELKGRMEATQSQVAATIARLVGEDFRAAVPQAAEPLTK